MHLLYTLLIPLSQHFHKLKTLTHPETDSGEFIIHIINRTTNRTNYTLSIKCSCINALECTSRISSNNQMQSLTLTLKTIMLTTQLLFIDVIYIQPHLTTTNCAQQQQHMSTTYTKLEVTMKGSVQSAPGLKF